VVVVVVVAVVAMLAVVSLAVPVPVSVSVSISLPKEEDAGRDVVAVTSVVGGKLPMLLAVVVLLLLLLLLLLVMALLLLLLLLLLAVPKTGSCDSVMVTAVLVLASRLALVLGMPIVVVTVDVKLPRVVEGEDGEG
jgi:hypothetical protein